MKQFYSVWRSFSDSRKLSEYSSQTQKSLVETEIKEVKPKSNLHFLCVTTALSMLVTTSLHAQNVPPDPGVGGTQAAFEVDASFKSGFIPPFWTSGTNYIPTTGTFGDDWSKGPSNNAVLKQSGGVSVPGRTTDGKSLWQIDGNWGNQSAAAEVVSFKGNSNKNGDAINIGQSPYSLQPGGSGPQKNDITQTFLHSRHATSNGHLWLFFGAQTRSQNGSSYLDFEYNQHGVTVSTSQLSGPANDATKKIINGRTVDDFILVINYTGGGDRPIVGVRKWLASGQWSEELPVGELGAFVTTNTLAVDAVAPNKSFGMNGAFTNTTAPLSFVEGGIDIDALELNLDECTPEATVTVKTRSSPSFTAELKDLDVMNFSLTPAATSVLTPNAALCEDTSGTTVFQVSGVFSNGTAQFSAVGGTVSNESYVDGVATADISVTTTGMDIATVYLTVSTPNESCPTAVDSIKLSVNMRPDGPTLSIVNPDCENATGTITVLTPANPETGDPIFEYRNNGGAWQVSNEFTFSGGDGYSIEVRAIADTVCISDATICPNLSPAPSGATARKAAYKATGLMLPSKLSSKLQVYPNPFSSNSTFEFTSEKSGQVVINVYDMNGRLVKEVYKGNAEAGVPNKITLEGSSLPEGMYISKLMIGGEQLQSHRFIIQR